jgi:hypothetical protein
VFLEGDNYLAESMDRINSIMDKIFSIPEALVKTVSQFKYLLSEDMKVYKREEKLKANDTPLSGFAEQLLNNENSKYHLLTLLHQNQLQLGPFFVDVSKVKVKMLSKIDERNDSI